MNIIKEKPMTAQIIDGKQIAADMRAELKAEVTKLKQQNIIPGLGVILVGEDPASQSYVTAKERACDDMGIYSDDNRLDADTSQAELMALVEKMNNDPKINGILVQLPLPEGLNESEVLLSIDPAKDVDGFHPMNVGKMVVGEQAFLPCTPHGVIQLLIRSGVTIKGAEVVIVGRSNIVGKPLMNMLIQKNSTGNATVTVCHTRTKDLSTHTKRADIVIAAAGRPNTVTADMVQEGVVVIDVGVNRIEDATKKKGYRLVGDVDFEAVKEKASLITPVPGGVGPMTITMLLYNTVESAKRAAGIDVEMQP
jgi:methylenetetrahydrofolate dehydrogenase (NADP+)/methenyltetrahydrofolate cyclohydrolase